MYGDDFYESPWADDDVPSFGGAGDDLDDEDEDEDESDFEDDGQPSEYDEWQDYMGGDDWDHGQYDNAEFGDYGDSDY